MRNSDSLITLPGSSVLELADPDSINNADGSQQRPYDTVVPLANELGITIDTSCEQQDNSCVRDVVDGYDGPGNILIW